MKPLQTDRLLLRNWEERDRDLFFHINADDRVMAYFAFRRDRAAADALMELLRAEINENGFGFAAAQLRSTGQTIGFIGLHTTTDLDFLAPGTVEIGWRLAPEFWGFGYATEAAEAWLEYGFEGLDLNEIVSFAVAGNTPSTAVMERLGMKRQPERDFDHPSVPESHPELKRHVFYQLTRADWRRARDRRGPKNPPSVHS